MELSKIELELDIESIKVHLTNLFNGDPLLGKLSRNSSNISEVKTVDLIFDDDHSSRLSWLTDIPLV